MAGAQTRRKNGTSTTHPARHRGTLEIMSEKSSSQGQARSPISRAGAITFLIVVLLVAAILAVTGIIPRLRARTKLQDETNALAAPDVLVAKPQQGKPT